MTLEGMCGRSVSKSRSPRRSPSGASVGEGDVIVLDDDLDGEDTFANFIAEHTSSDAPTFEDKDAIGDIPNFEDRQDSGSETADDSDDDQEQQDGPTGQGQKQRSL